MKRWSAVVALALTASLLAACSSAGDVERPTTLRPAWRAITLPVPPGPAGRVAVRDAAVCDGTWYVVGAVLGPDGASRPAAWQSDDLRTWEPVALAPSAYYARRAILGSVACRDGHVAALGARSGGAHGNPRTTSWYLRADGTLVDARAPFELFGGPAAVSVRRVAAGPAGWLIVGNRLTGGAVWTSSDATSFRILEHDPALSSDAGHRTSVLDQVADGTGWTVVGRAETPDRAAPAPLAWTSPDGTRWTRQEVPATTGGFADLERVVTDRAGLVAAGIRDRHFGLWRRTDGVWRAAGSFGRLATGGGEPPFVSGLVARDGTLLATVSDGDRYRAWTGTADGGWQPLALPVTPRSTGDTQVTVAADDDAVLLLTDDGSTGRVWASAWSAVSPG
ncbi:hypothetical protein [Nocardioides pocheonensis]|uniref:Exo-alpha-sialidase n=1 Tax=Nocardioides pocheonensis TaxID=661485 RepID=A0A3N0GLM2_9ACTN|nr:hypothetical protein [Nocardioides pocheonensis]RNM13038.1 hypothetical protein EFL26_16545 [Nocardioides pocheonensis]